MATSAPSYGLSRHLLRDIMKEDGERVDVTVDWQPHTMSSTGLTNRRHTDPAPAPTSGLLHDTIGQMGDTRRVDDPDKL